MRLIITFDICYNWVPITWYPQQWPLGSKEAEDHSSFRDCNRVGYQKTASLSLFTLKEMSHLEWRGAVCDALIRPKYTFATYVNPRRLIFRSDIQHDILSLSLSPPLSLSLSVTWRVWCVYTHRLRASLRFWHSSFFGAATNWKLPFRAHGRREIEINWFFRQADSHRDPRSLRFTIFGRNSRSRSWEPWRARRALERLRKKNEQIETKKRFAFLAYQISPLDNVASHTESFEMSAADGQNNNDKREAKKKGIKIAEASRAALRRRL